MTFAAGNLNEGAAVVFFKLALSNWNRFYAAISPGGNVPEEIHVRPLALIIKPW